ncbi:MAG: T9SS type A sorting domain-containing protein [Bacteroidota bacterium]
MSHHLLFRSVLFLLLLFGGLHLKVYGSSHLAIHTLDDLPAVLDDTTSYSFDVYVVNKDPFHSWVDPINIFISVNGDEGTVLKDAVIPPMPILPGDSLLVNIDEYPFDPARFLTSGGGGITHDIIVWPSFLGLPQTDSADKSVIFLHTQSSDHLRVSAPSGFPNTIKEGQAYHLTFEVENLDLSSYLFDPVTLYMSINGDSGTVLIQNVMLPQAIPPGMSFGIDIPNYTFNSARFSGGGGITHDIIVWPMTLSLGTSDSLSVIARYLPTPPPSPLTDNLVIDSNNLLDLSTINVFPNPSQDHIKFSLELSHMTSVEIMVSDIAGRTVIVKKWGDKTGATNLELPLSTLANGMYLFQIRTDSETFQGKFMKE